MPSTSDMRGPMPVPGRPNVLVYERQDGTRSFYFRFRDQHGVRRKAFLGTKVRELDSAIAKIRTEVDAGTYVHPRDEERVAAERAAAEQASRGPTFREFAKTFAEDRRVVKRNRSAHYAPVLKRLTEFFGDKHLREITRGDVYAFKTERSCEVAAGTVRRDLAGLVTIFNVALRMEVVDRNPAALVEKPPPAPPKRTWATPEQFRAWIAQLAPDDVPTGRMAAYTGLRLLEVVSIEVAHYDAQAGTLTLTGRNKDQSNRTVPLNQLAIEVLERAIEARRAEWRAACAAAERILPDPTLIFLWRGEPQVDRAARTRLSQRFATAAERAGLDLTFHDLRRSFGTWSRKAGASIDDLQELLGHSTPELTRRVYAHVDGNDLRPAAARVVAFLSADEKGPKTGQNRRGKKDAKTGKAEK